MTAVVITAALFFCNITPLKNAAKDSLPCPDNTNKFILFWVKYRYRYIGIYRYRHFGHFLTHFAALSVTDTKQMVTIWTSRFEDLSLNCDLG